MTARSTDPAVGPDDARDARRVRVVPHGPVLVEGPVEVVCADGTTRVCDRFMVALCMCGASRIRPLCDSSHRRSRPRR